MLLKKQKKLVKRIFKKKMFVYLQQQQQQGSQLQNLKIIFLMDERSQLKLFTIGSTRVLDRYSKRFFASKIYLESVIDLKQVNFI